MLRERCANKMERMKRIIQVRIFSGDKYYVREGFDLPVVTLGATLDELMKNVEEAIALQLEGENPADFGLAPNASILATNTHHTESPRVGLRNFARNLQAGASLHS